MAMRTASAAWTDAAILTHAPNDLSAAASLRRESQRQGARRQSAHHDLDGGQNVRASTDWNWSRPASASNTSRAEMIKANVLLGAEESGGIGFPGHIPERDGIAAGLMLLELLATERKSVNKMIARLGETIRAAQIRPDRHAFPFGKAAGADGIPPKKSACETAALPLKDVKSYDGVKFIAEDSSWLMLRGSGTEPILRIYAESSSDANVSKLLKLGVQLTKQV